MLSCVLCACVSDLSVETEFSSEDCHANKKSTLLVQIFHTNTMLVFTVSALTLTGEPNKMLNDSLYENRSLFLCGLK